MNEPLIPTDKSELSRVSRAVRFALAALVLGMSYPNIHCAFGIPKFQQIYQDMLMGKPLPQVTEFVVRFQIVFEALSILLPVLALGSVAARGTTRPLYVVGGVVLGIFVQIFFQWFALTLPLFGIIKEMQAPLG